MKNPLHTPFVAIFQNEMLLNSKRVAPYALMILFAAYAVLLWGWGPAVRLGWATNSDFYIVRNLLGVSFLFFPMFNAVIMGDPVIRDFRAEIDPLIFSKPISRADYLLGKFFGNFFVLVCCTGAFPLVLLVLQAFRTSQMIVQPVRVFPYFKHFLFFVVITHLVLAAFYFTVGTLTRNSKIAYGLAVCFYTLYISYGMLLLRPLSDRWRLLLDPMLLGTTLRGNGFLHTADFLNHYVVAYTSEMIANRAIMLGVAAVCLTILCFRFRINPPERNAETFSALNLSTASERLYYDPETSEAALAAQSSASTFELTKHRSVPLPEVARENQGTRASLRKLVAATALELRLLRSERSLVVLVPLALLMSFLSLPFSATASAVSHSASFASHSANGLLLFLLGVNVFYIGESMHRDREVRIEPVIWSAPTPSSSLVLSKFLATFVFSLSLLVLVGLTAVITQLLRGLNPIEIQYYVITNSIILVPNLIFIAAAAIALNVLLRDKYLAYAIAIGISVGLFYLYSQGHSHWLYNPLAYGLWTESDLVIGVPGLPRLIALRLYTITLGLVCLLIAHLFFARPKTALDKKLVMRSET